MENRKNNRLKEFDYSTNGAYFVTICVLDMKCKFNEFVGEGFPLPQSTNTKIVQKYINEIPIKYPCVNIDKYVIMPNHIHILLQIQNYGTGNPSPTISNIIGWFKYQTTKEINMNNNVKNKFWQRSFHDHIIRGKDDYNMIWTYIDNNPLKWELDKYYINP